MQSFSMLKDTSDSLVGYVSRNGKVTTFIDNDGFVLQKCNLPYCCMNNEHIINDGVLYFGCFSLCSRH